MARMVDQNMKPGIPDKPGYLPAGVSTEWDRIMGEIAASGIGISKAHRSLVEQAAFMTADIKDALDVLQIEGKYQVNEKTGVTQSHPAARRLDGMRRDLIKVLSLLGLRSATGESEEKEDSLADMLAE